MNISDMDIKSIKGIGEKTAALFNRVGVYSLWDLMNYIPCSYERYPEICPVSEIRAGEKCALRLTVVKNATVINASGLKILSTAGSDDTGSVLLSWYNMPYLKKVIIPGMQRVFYGRADIKNGSFILKQPRMMKEEEYSELGGKLVPVYPLTRGLTQKGIGHAVKAAFSQSGDADDYLTDNERMELEVGRLEESLYDMHFPKDIEHTVKARERIVFDEFLYFIQSIRKLKQDKERAANDFPMIETAETSRLIEMLPYRLTGAQMKAYREIIGDLTGSMAMNRLVQGDVGSGKTIVAVLALVTAAMNGHQSALMAPTEVLASQHMKKISELTEVFGIKCVLLTGSLSAKEKRMAKEQIKSGNASIIIGTHALITDTVEFKDLALVITDEQHRFGVKQRAALSGKCHSRIPHVLVMSATPIPRTLAIIIYGDLDISVMDEMPAKRLQIKNCVVGKDYRPKAYSFIKNEVKNGHQAYVICPQVEESESTDEENVTGYGEKLKEIFGDSVRVGILHGRMRPKDKNLIMSQFATGDIDVLVSTTVIEVGVDVPNATVMMIENAERFGLSELHQIRGRIGRGDAQGYCIFINTSRDNTIKKRLEILNHSNDGFKIAEEDLKLRGPGDIFGLRQSGEAMFRVGDMFTDAVMLKKAADFASAHPDIGDRMKIYDRAAEKNVQL